MNRTDPAKLIPKGPQLFPSTQQKGYGGIRPHPLKTFIARFTALGNQPRRREIAPDRRKIWAIVV
jgi:hypothetical protein